MNKLPDLSPPHVAPSAAPDPQDRVLPTLENDGSRRWLSPRLAPGRYWVSRQVVAWALIAFFTVIPFINIGGQPAVLIDIVGRRLTLLGATFLPRDTFLLALLMLTCGLSVFLFTALAGRVWCGWGCPQTVYMEFVFRPLERLFYGTRGRGGRASQQPAPWRIAAFYAVSLVVCLLLTHTFLSYFVGVEALRHWVTRSPAEHPWSFAVIALTTGGLMFNFCYFREQMCTVACPYGRFQSVLLDADSLAVRYDTLRGEPRTKRRLSLPVSGGGVGRTGGACVDCGLCVKVCPTGIDIRQGTQMECINCTQCIDACDAVMDKLSLPRGLIRYASLTTLGGGAGKLRLLRPRTLAYAVLLAVVGSMLGYQLTHRNPLDVLLVRNPGLPFFVTADGLVEGTVRVQMTNRTQDPVSVTIDTTDVAVQVAERSDRTVLAPGETLAIPLHLLARPADFTQGKRAVSIRLNLGNGPSISRDYLLFGPE